MGAFIELPSERTPDAVYEVDLEDEGMRYFDFENASPYYALIEFSWDRNSLVNRPDYILRPFTNQVVSLERPERRVSFVLATKYPAAAGGGDSIFGFIAARHALSPTPATHKKVGLFGTIETPNVAIHGSTHRSVGTDPIPAAVPLGASGLMSGADKDKLDTMLAYTLAEQTKVAQIMPGPRILRERTTSSPTLTTNTWTNINLNGNVGATVARDITNAAGLWTISLTGLYLLWFYGTYLANTTGDRMVGFSKNGADGTWYNRRPASAGDSGTLSSVVAWLTAGDTIFPQAYQSSGANLQLGATLQGGAIGLQT